MVGKRVGQACCSRETWRPMGLEKKRWLTSSHSRDDRDNAHGNENDEDSKQLFICLLDF